MKKATFYHAGCPVCVSAEQQFVGAIDASKYEVEIVHPGEAGKRIAEAEGFGVKRGARHGCGWPAVSHQL